MMSEAAAKIQSPSLHVFLCASLALTAACTTTPTPVTPSAPVAVPAKPATPPAPPVAAKPAPAAPAAAAGAVFRSATWSELPGWREDNAAEAWSALLASCTVLNSRELWREPCTAAARAGNPGAHAARTFFEQHFAPYQVASTESGEEGLITGYYEPLLRGSRKPGTRYRYPLYGVPDDLIVVDLGELYPELKNMRLRGRLEGRRLVPYHDRAQIESAETPLRGKEIVW